MKPKEFINELTNTARIITALSGACIVIIGLLGWISLKITNISTDFRKAVAIVPVVEQNTKDIADIKNNYVIASKFEEHQKFVITEIDTMIDECNDKIIRKKPLNTSKVNKLIYYRDNLNFLTYKQKKVINYIEKIADRQVKQ